MISFLIKIFTRSNVYTNARFSRKRIRNSKFEFVHIRKLVKRKTQLLSLFYCSPHPFKVISHETNPPFYYDPSLLLYLSFSTTSPCLLCPPPPTILHMRVSYEHHVQTVWRRINKTTDFLRKLQPTLPKKSLAIYKSFIRPHLDYGSMVYSF